MPQVYEYIEELKLVDWDVIIIYTCVNPECLIKAGQGFYKEEFAYIQMSDDFKNVRYGTKE